MVGGGISGVAVALSLDGACNVILVDPKDTFILPYTTHRSMTYGDGDALIPWSRLFARTAPSSKAAC